MMLTQMVSMTLQQRAAGLSAALMGGACVLWSHCRSTAPVALLATATSLDWLRVVPSALVTLFASLFRNA
jgi:hypothetical protein